jgi:hypothetical protein
MCKLSFVVVNNIFQNHNTHESFQSMHIDENCQNLSLLFNMQGISSTPTKKITNCKWKFIKKKYENFNYNS